MKSFNIFEDKDKLVFNYSLGMKKKLGIIQAFMENQSIIILNEPTASLDEKSILEFYSLVNEVKKDKIIIITLHLKGDIQTLATKVLVIEDKKLRCCCE